MKRKFIPIGTKHFEDILGIKNSNHYGLEASLSSYLMTKSQEKVSNCLNTCLADGI